VLCITRTAQQTEPGGIGILMKLDVTDVRTRGYKVTEQTEPALGEGEQGPRPGPRACGGPAGHQRGAPDHAKTKRGGASARGTAHGSVSGVRLAHFGAPQCAGRRKS